MTHPTLTRVLARPLARLLPAAVVLGAGLTLVAPPAAQALDDLSCAEWSQKGYSIEDPEYGEVFVIEARCEKWIWQPPIVEPPGSDEPGKIPPGTGGGGKEPPSCKDAEERIDELRAQLASDRREADAASIVLTTARTVEAAAWALMESERDDVEQAEDAVATAKLAYLAQAGIDGIEREMRNGAVIVRPANVTRASVDRNLPTGRALIAAMDDLSQELTEEHAAEYDYAQAAAAADAYADAWDSLQAEIARLQRELLTLQRAARACAP